MISFNGNNKEIIIDSSEYDEEIMSEKIYSAWKKWVFQDLNAKYLPAFKMENISDKKDNYKISLINDWEIIYK